jgi:hypothetical protein
MIRINNKKKKDFILDKYYIVQVHLSNTFVVHYKMDI